MWFDALLNYYTALGYARPGEDLTDRFWPAQFHVIGKDILKFHTVFWPALLMAAELPVPEHVFVHGFLLGADGRKMSKSLGNVLDPFEVLDKYGTDALRFYLMRDVSFGGDGAVSMERVTSRYESELANEYGNLASRTIAMILRYRDGTIPDVETDPVLGESFAGLSDDVIDLIDAAEVTDALDIDLAAGAAVQSVRRGEHAVAAGQGPRAGAAAGSGAGVAGRGGAGDQRAAGAVRADQRPQAAGCARRARPVVGGRELRAARRRTLGERARAALPRQRVIDSHTHLHLCEGTPAELVAAADEAGVTRMVTVGHRRRLVPDRAGHRRGLPPGLRRDRPPSRTQATGFDDADFAELQALAAHEKCVAIGETGLDYYRDGAPPEDQKRAFVAQIELARDDRPSRW